MAMTNVQRQTAFRNRRNAHFVSSVSPAEVMRAVRLCYDAHLSEQGQTADFEKWREKALKDRSGALWRKMMPTKTDPDDYPASLSPTQRKFLAKVAAVCRVVLNPP